MKTCVRSFYKFAVTIAALCLSFITLNAQTKNQPQSSATIARQAKTNAEEPFRVGEKLVYEAKYSRLVLRGITVAELIFNVVEDEQNQLNKIRIKAEAVSKGSLLKLASFNFLQRFDCTVQTDADNFRILQTVRRDEQDKRVRSGEANFDYARQKLVYREIDPNNPLAPPRVIMSPLGEGAVQDLVSAFYFLRRQPLVVGNKFILRLSDSGVVYEVPVTVAAREQVNSILGKTQTVRVEPEIFGEKRPLAGDGKLMIWMTDDERHLPVRAQIQSDVGKVEIKLRKADNLQPAK